MAQCSECGQTVGTTNGNANTHQVNGTGTSTCGGSGQPAR